MDTIIERIKKLQAMAESAHRIGNIEEASAFAGKVSELLMRHKLSMGDLTADTADELRDLDTLVWQYTPGKSRVGWKVSLANAIASNNFCSLLSVTGTPTVHLFGTKADIENVQYLYNVLVTMADRLGAAYPGTRADKNTFRLGFVNAIARRMREAKASETAKGGQYAITVFGQAEAQVKAYQDDWLRRHGYSVRNGAGARSAGSRSAYEAGKAAGSNASWHRATTSGTAAKGARLLNA